jgi:hypothetical protein
MNKKEQLPKRAKRERPEHKTASKEELEEKAKGRGIGHRQEAVLHQNESKNRGNQKGFGKNQGKEASDRSTAHGTRAAGAEGERND